MPNQNVHVEGPGLKVVGDTEKRWYGPGYCGTCGHRGESLVPVRVRWWDPDDGWKTGVLCVGCGAEVRERGPDPEDFASVTYAGPPAAVLDAIDEANAGDDDAALTDTEDAK